MKIYSKFVKRPSGAHLYIGECVIKTGPDCLKEAELLSLVSSRITTPEVYAVSPDVLVLEKVPLARKSLDITFYNHYCALTELHTSRVINPQWRLCSIQDYIAYCSRPVSSNVPPKLYGLLNTLGQDLQYTKPVFIHGDATLSNSVISEKDIYLIDLSTRVTPGDPMQDWAKMLFSVLGFDVPYTESIVAWFSNLNELKGCFEAGPDLFIEDKKLAFYFVSNLIRVMRKEQLAPGFWERSQCVLRNYL